MRVFILLILVCTAAAVGELAKESELLNRARADMWYGNIAMENPHMKTFEKTYFIDPGDTHASLLNSLTGKVMEMRKNVKHSFPFAGYNSLDTNLYNRMVKEDVENEQYRKIGTLLDEIKHLKEKTYPTVPVVDPSVVADMKFSIKQIDKARNNNELRFPHTPLFIRPYEDGKESITKLNKRINEMNSNIRRPLVAPEPTQEELAALRRLNEKMGVVSSRVHSLPSPHMEDHILVQSQMLSGLSDLLRKMVSAVDVEHREAFLYQVHSLLHTHHLHDHPEIQQFERELARTIATGNRFSNADIRLPAPYDSTQRTFDGGYDLAQYEVARSAALKERNVAEAERAHDVSHTMKGYGKELVDKAKEMRHRADMMDRLESVPTEQAVANQRRVKLSTY